MLFLDVTHQSSNVVRWGLFGVAEYRVFCVFSPHGTFVSANRRGKGANTTSYTMCGDGHQQKGIAVGGERDEFR